ncbi:MAG: hypothetical protein CBC52_004015, partial [Gammaproteobacteria bacterium TMED92]
MEQHNTPWFLRGNWAPTQQQHTSTDLKVTGSIPPQLNGVYVRTGPNPGSGKAP